MHADQAAVNVNFWLTPDDANLNPDHGGLVVYDANAPADWEAAEYNGNDPRVWDFLKRAGAKPCGCQGDDQGAEDGELAGSEFPVPERAGVGVKRRHRPATSPGPA